MSQYSVAKELHKMTLRRITIFFGKNAHKTRKGENSQYSVAKRGSVAGLPYQPVTNAPLYFKHLNFSSPSFVIMGTNIPINMI